jgi:hypothetical protein
VTTELASLVTWLQHTLTILLAKLSRLLADQAGQGAQVSVLSISNSCLHNQKTIGELENWSMQTKPA